MDKLLVKVSVPMKGEEVEISGDIIFMGVEGMYRLPAGRYTMPIPMWEKMTVESSYKESSRE